MTPEAHRPPAERHSGEAGSRLRSALGRLPLIGMAARTLARHCRRRAFPGSAAYWNERYAMGGDSGPGSRGRLAAHKATVLNRLLEEYDVQSAIEFGCGDGRQLSLVHYPSYVGLDVSPQAIHACMTRFAADPTKSFFLYSPRFFSDRIGLFKADMSVSLDVIYHLVEDAVYATYMRHLFEAARRVVVVYSTDVEGGGARWAPHVRHRCFSAWVERNIEGWRRTDIAEQPCSPHWPAEDQPPCEFALYTPVP